MGHGGTTGAAGCGSSAWPGAWRPGRAAGRLQLLAEQGCEHQAVIPVGKAAIELCRPACPHQLRSAPGHFPIPPVLRDAEVDEGLHQLGRKVVWV